MLKVIEIINYTLGFSKYILKDLRNIVYNGIKQNEYIIKLFGEYYRNV